MLHQQLRLRRLIKNFNEDLHVKVQCLCLSLCLSLDTFAEGLRFLGRKHVLPHSAM